MDPAEREAAVKTLVDGRNVSGPADIVAGAIRARKDSGSGHCRLIEDFVHEIAVETDC